MQYKHEYSQESLSASVVNRITFFLLKSFACLFFLSFCTAFQIIFSSKTQKRRTSTGEKKRSDYKSLFSKATTTSYTAYLRLFNLEVKSLISIPDSLREDKVPGTSSDTTLDSFSLDTFNLLKAWKCNPLYPLAEGKYKGT